MVACTLCGGSAGREVASASAREVCQAYARVLHVDVSGEMGPAIDDRIRLLECDSCGLRFYSPAVVGSSAFYDDMQKHDWYYPSERVEFVDAAPFVLPGHSVLEIGCGKGLFAGFIRPREYLGMDFSEKARRAAAAAGVRVIGDRLEDYAAAHPEAHDVVVAFQVLEHVPSPRSFLEDALRCLRPGGLLVLSMPAEDSYTRLAHNHLMNMPPHHQSRWSRRAVESIGRELSLRLVALSQQPLADEQLRDFAAVALEALLRGWREPRALVDYSGWGRFRWRTCNSMGKRLARLLRPAWFRPPGITQTAVFRKGG